jgi:hypothetical protein
MGLIGILETSVSNPLTPRNNPEDEITSTAEEACDLASYSVIHLWLFNVSAVVFVS